MVKALRHLLLITCVVALAPHVAARADDLDTLPPYRLIRSLQSVQDSIVTGDHAAGEMQRYMLSTIDARLRAAPQSVFDDPRNVDAALIYAMSGGNPETLAKIVNADIQGNFDTRITDALSHYLRGKGALMVEQLKKVMPEYRGSRIGPYLSLVMGNALAIQKPEEAVGYYNWARLTAPGTNIEEAALRRSLMLATRGGRTDEAFRYALSYARRFLGSPYASQFADIFVDLAVPTYSEQTAPRIEEILSFLDRPRQREVYLRIARRSAISGKPQLTKLASEKAADLSGHGADQADALATLYSGLVDVPSSDIVEAVRSMNAISPEALSPRDRALRDAATAVADEVLRPPVPQPVAAVSPAQATSPSVPVVSETAAGEPTGSGDSPFSAPVQQPASPVPTAEAEPTEAASDPKPDPAFEAFVDQGKSTLSKIDALLQGGT